MYTIPILLTLAAKSLFSRVQGDYIQRYNGVASSTISGGRQTGNWLFHDPRPAQLGSGAMIYITIEEEGEQKGRRKEALCPRQNA